jgi:acyl-CoA synthetase (AMP-forming)/AMP-acid ligase II
MSASAAESVSVHDAFSAAAEKFPTRPLFALPAATAAAYGLESPQQSYVQAAAQVEELSDEYRRAGLCTGDRVALILENRPEFFCHFLSLNSLGVSIVPLHHEMPPEEIGYRLQHSEACTVITLETHAALARAACRAGGVDIPVVATGQPLPRRHGTASGAAVSRDTEAAILYTSGSTGTPKGCLLSNDYFLLMGEWYTGQGGLCTLAPSGERILTPLPVSHMNALTCSFMAALMSGSCLIQLDRFHPSTWWADVRETKASVVHYLGVLPAILLKLPESPDDDFGAQVKFGFGAGVDPRHQEIFERRFGFPLIEAWAMTETGSGACVAASAEPRHVGTRCFGKAPEAMAYRIVDEAGNEVVPGEPGELLVRANGEDPRRGFFTAYFKDAAATREAWDGGWFHTGDVVRVDGEGSFYFVDRRKNIVRRSGENIAAVEVEGVLMRDERVAACAVAPVQDETRGEEVMACIVLDQDVSPTRDTAIALFEQSLSTLAYFKAPGYIAFVDKLPLTSSEKLQRGRVKELCTELCGTDDAIDLRELKRRPRRQT